MTVSPTVHLIAKQDAWILGRYANILKKNLGWSMGASSNSKAKINIFWPYLLLMTGQRLPETKTVAFFTHLEESGSQGKNSKIDRWHYAAQSVDLRICMTRKYESILQAHGPTAYVTVPIETKKFTPRRLRVGVAGKVYKLSRKGEQLVKQLVATKEFEVVGAGKGWPCPTKFYAWDQMQLFYQSLDIFLVTSDVEGGPVTMLEALSCGVPVVAPTGVGMIDEYPVATYERGNFQSMLARLRMFNFGRNKRSGIVSQRTAKKFVQDCQYAIKTI